MTTMLDLPQPSEKDYKDLDQGWMMFHHAVLSKADLHRTGRLLAAELNSPCIRAIFIERLFSRLKSLREEADRKELFACLPKPVLASLLSKEGKARARKRS